MGEVPWWALTALACAGVAVSALTAAGEAALQRLALAGDDDLPALAPRRRRRIRRLVVRSDQVIPAAAFARVFFQVMAGIAVGALAARAAEGWAAFGLGAAAAVVVAVVVAVIRPRARASAEPVRALAVAGPWMNLFSVVLAPLRPLLRRFTPQAMLLSPDELGDLLENVSTTDAIAPEDRAMLSSVVELGSTLARELMVPRTDVVTLSDDLPLRKAMALFLRSGHSRLPVVGADGLDSVAGVAYLKDASLVLQARPDAADEPISAVMRPAVFVPESKPADDVLRELQSLGTHIALVVDEYGGVAGLLTIEDVLEEIVGELTDEHDPDPPEVEPLGDGVWRLPARLELDRLEEVFDLDITDDDVDTVAGLLAKAVGRVPISGSQAEVDGLILTAERTEGRRKQLATVLARRAVRLEAEDDE
ncbi:MAG: hemolysin family protein [Bifidobacteriaceae bacterium]|jgi:CBS domain containing-hemolysin-like protein|nr:hemolysin family protein [Bifidobacteriaceae bacterium]